MKKTLFNSLGLIMVILLTALFAVSCGGTPAAASQQKDPGAEFMAEVRREAPEGAVIGIGTARMATTNQSMVQAENRARVAIARQLDSAIQQMIDDFTASSEIDPSIAIAYQREVSRTLTQSRLQGAYNGPFTIINGETWFAVYFKKSDATREVNQALSAARLAVPAAAAFNAMTDMEAAFARMHAAPPLVVRD